jgi:D-alanyl-lipoteichoic acid acyltransferase DltB (MBOAT superfamily)
LLFGLQIYGDFCGYSYMAKGIALLLGFDLMWNFDRPYWSTSIREFWRRWHISLSQWLRDFLYVPLGGNRHGELRTHANLMTTMLLGGLWHGAGWNFIAWGGLHGAALVVNRLWARLGDRWQPRPALGWLMTMMVVMFGWFLFRATSRDLIVTMVRAFSDLRWVPFHTTMCIAMVALGTPLLLVEWMQRRTGDPCFPVHWPIPLRSVLTGALVVVVYALSERVRSEFIYFKF